MENQTTAPKKQRKVTDDVYTIVTDRIIKQLEKGSAPWHKPWTDAGVPTNLVSERPYSGINVMLLASLGYERNLFITSKQLKKIGGSIKPEEHPNIVIFWNMMKKDGEEATETENGQKKPPVLKYYTVFNIEQCVLPQDMVLPMVSRQLQPIPACEMVVEHMPNRPDIKHKEHRAYYNPIDDFVNMPKQKTFESDEAYYSVLFHELIHSTGHVSRLARRDIIQMSEHGYDAYSHEELVAEIGACFLQSVTGITEQFEQSAAYIQGWLKRLKNDKKFIFSASTHAQKASDYILNVHPEAEHEAVEE